MTEDGGRVAVIGGTRGIGRGIVRHHADQGREVVLTGRDGGRPEAVAEEIGGRTTALALDLAEPRQIAYSLASVGTVEHVVTGAVDRDENAVRDYDIDGAINS